MNLYQNAPAALEIRENYQHRYHQTSSLLNTRLILGLLAIVVAAGIVSNTAQQRSTAWLVAQGMAGQHWYRLLLDKQHIGYLASKTGANANGEWHFSSDLRFAMSESTPVQIQQTLVFSSTAPYRLIQANYLSKRRQNRLAITAQIRNEPGAPLPSNGPATYQITVQRNAEHSEQQLAWQFRLADYLAFEVWLQLESPAPGAKLSVPNLELEQLQLTSKVMQLQSQDDTGYQVANPAPQAASLIDLQPNFVPRRLRLAGLFDLHLSSQADALAPRSALQHASYQIPLDQPLRNHLRLDGLDLQVHPNDENPWPQPLKLRANPISDPTPATAADLAATPEYPVDHPHIHALLAPLDLAHPPIEQVATLVNFVHNYLSYQAQVHTTPVLDLLETRSGDCSEYADLFTSLARATGIPSRTVHGLAYSDSPSPALRFHAWNEVYVDGQWQALDPTWNQLNIDASHLLLPTNESAALHLLTGRSELRFEVLATHYRSNDGR